MHRYTRKAGAILAGATLLQFGSCVSQGQSTDFVRTEFARILSDVVGQLVQIVLTGVFSNITL